MVLTGARQMAALSVLVRPKCGQGSWATTPARPLLDSQVRLDVGLSGTSDPFRVRELCRSRLLSYLGNDLRRVVRTRPLVSVAVSGDRYSVGYSVARVVLADR
jgi:hypothetical protein